VCTAYWLTFSFSSKRKNYHCVEALIRNKYVAMIIDTRYAFSVHIFTKLKVKVEIKYSLQLLIKGLL
jgi:hypothetical protein